MQPWIRNAFYLSTIVPIFMEPVALSFAFADAYDKPALKLKLYCRRRECWLSCFVTKEPRLSFFLLCESSLAHC
jgi:hypothetical protein